MSMDKVLWHHARCTGNCWYVLLGWLYCNRLHDWVSESVGL